MRPHLEPRIPGLRRFFRLPSAERDVHALVDDETAFHIDMLADQLAAEGHPPEAARREALRRSVTSTVSAVGTTLPTTRRQCAARVFSTVWQTRLRHQRLRRAAGHPASSPAPSLGSRARRDVSVVRGVLHGPIPFRAERVVRLGRAIEGRDRAPISAPRSGGWGAEPRASGDRRVRRRPMGQCTRRRCRAGVREDALSRAASSRRSAPGATRQHAARDETVDGANQVIVVSDAFGVSRRRAKTVVGREIQWKEAFKGRRVRGRTSVRIRPIGGYRAASWPG